MASGPKILALETTQRTASIAALVGAQAPVERRLDAGRRTAQSLAPAIRDLLREVAWQADDVDLVAVTIGPGSFTGLRIGVTTAKTFAYATGAHVVGVPTLEAIAHRAPATFARLSVAIDAERGEVFAARFDRLDDGQWRELEPVRILGREAWLAGLRPDESATGTALRRIGDDLPDGITIVDESFWSPSALAVGQIAFRRFVGGQRDDLWRLVPQYHRKSAAEEKRGEK